MNPRASTKLGASGYFVMCAVILFCLVSADPDAVMKVKGWAFLLGCAAFGLLTLKVPLLTTFLGSLVFGGAFVKFVGSGLESGEPAQYPLGFAIVSLVSAYVAISMLQGFAVSLWPWIPRILDATRKSPS